MMDEMPQGVCGLDLGLNLAALCQAHCLGSFKKWADTSVPIFNNYSLKRRYVPIQPFSLFGLLRKCYLNDISF